MVAGGRSRGLTRGFAATGAYGVALGNRMRVESLVREQLSDELRGADTHLATLLAERTKAVKQLNGQSSMSVVFRTGPLLRMKGMA